MKIQKGSKLAQSIPAVAPFVLTFSEPFAKLPKPKVLLVFTAANGAELAARAANVEGTAPEALGASPSPSAIRVGAGLSPSFAAGVWAAPLSCAFASAAEAVLAVAPAPSAGKICRAALSSESCCTWSLGKCLIHPIFRSTFEAFFN